MRKSHTIEFGFGRKYRRTVTLTVGETCRVEPLNHRKKRHRDRVCTILEFEEDFHPHFAVVQFHDNNRRGKVDLADLVPLTQDVVVEQ